MENRFIPGRDAAGDHRRHYTPTTVEIRRRDEHDHHEEQPIDLRLAVLSGSAS
jgi:hypothetical protein